MSLFDKKPSLMPVVITLDVWQFAVEGRQGQRGLPGKGKYAEVATKIIPEPATSPRRCAARGLVCAIIRRTIFGDAVTLVLSAPATATDTAADTLFDSWILIAIHRFAALVQKPSSLRQQVLTALRSLVQNDYRLNNPACGSNGWLTENALWLISKTTADKVLAWLLQHSVSCVPENNNRLFDELLAHQLIVANEDKAIWRCTIRSDKSWSPIEPLTLLRLAPSAIWEQDKQHPASFAGSVTPVSEAEPAPGLSTLAQPSPEIADDPRLGENNTFLQWLKNYTSP